MTYLITVCLFLLSTFFRFTSGLLYCVNGQQDTSFICSNLDSVNFLAFGEQHIDKISVHRGQSEEQTKIFNNHFSIILFNKLFTLDIHVHVHVNYNGPSIVLVSPY